MSIRMFAGLVVAAGLAATNIPCPAARAQETGEDAPAPREVMVEQARNLRPLVKTGLANHFLDAVADLPAVKTRRVYYNRATRDAMTPEVAASKDSTELEGYEESEIDEQFYYFTRYGTPLAFVRPLEILGLNGLESVDGARVADFGFGSIGQLRALAALGAEVTGIEVDELLKAVYSSSSDTGPVARATGAGAGKNGRVALCFGQFPAEPDIVAAVGKGYGAFISKNTLKNGYIHPEEEVDPRMLVHLGVDDETFVRAVYDLLAPGGLFMIYNLCPPPSQEKYIPWADGRAPFTRDLFESVGFTVVAYNVDDSAPARDMGRALGWDEQMNLESDIFGTYTLVRK